MTNQKTLSGSEATRLKTKVDKKVSKVFRSPFFSDLKEMKEDICSKSLVAVMEGIHKAREKKEHNDDRWISGVVNNKVYDTLRHRIRHKHVVSLSGAFSCYDSDKREQEIQKAYAAAHKDTNRLHLLDGFSQAEMSIYFKQVVDVLHGILNKQQWKIVVDWMNGSTAKEIKEKFGVSENYVPCLISRIRPRVRSALEEGADSQLAS